MEKNLPLVIISGPTASGKTALSIELAKKYGAEIISADSMQIYKYMDIGTAKPTPEEKSGIAHHMIDIIEPSEPFSVYDYQQSAFETIDDMHSRGVLPIMVGGTGFYISSVTDNTKFSSFENDYEYREEKLEYVRKCGQSAVDELYGELLKIDPEAAKNIHPNNIKRVIRALEIYKTSGKTMTYHNKHSKLDKTKYNICYIVLAYKDRELLYERINKRVDIMLSLGLENEVRSLLERGYGRDLTSMQAIGYKEWFDYFDGKSSYDETVEILKRNSRRYAKRQMTWFRKTENTNVIYIDEEKNPEKIKNKCYNYIENLLKV